MTDDLCYLVALRMSRGLSKFLDIAGFAAVTGS
jgi:hypothetical protein